MAEAPRTTATSGRERAQSSPTTISAFLRRLVADGALSAAHLEEARAHRAGSKQSLLQSIVQLGFLAEGKVLELLAKHTGTPVVDLSGVTPDQALIDRLPYRVARERGVLPLRIEDRHAVVAVADPTDIMARDEVGMLLGLPVSLVLAAPTAI